MYNLIIEKMLKDCKCKLIGIQSAGVFFDKDSIWFNTPDNSTHVIFTDQFCLTAIIGKGGII